MPTNKEKPNKDKVNEISKVREKQNKNLIPFSERNESELREMTRKGGENSGKAREKKKKLKEQMQVIANILTANKLEEDNLTEKQKIILKNSDILIAELYNLLNSNKEEIKLKALESIIEKTHGKTIATPDEATIINVNMLNTKLELLVQRRLQNKEEA